jgi:glucose-6-phosphate 1-dehydrogenase
MAAHLMEMRMSTVVHVTPRESAPATPLPQGDSCVLVIFGASGDLTRRKLVPALFDLACFGCTNPRFEVVGVGRTRMSSDQFRDAMRTAVAQGGAFDEPRWAAFGKQLHYLAGDINDASFFPKLAQHLRQMRSTGSSANHFFYVSIPASLATPVVEGLGAAGLAKNAGGWSRIVLEKPFGRDLESAVELNRTVRGVFDEADVYRIDHYLGKETVQNILVFRFGNSMFEPVWNRNYVDYVEITASETLGVEGRATFYEETGALRDMVANHLLQLLTLTAMEPPVAFEADSVRAGKVQVLHAIHPMTVEEVARRTVRGQYGPGQADGKPVPGYRQEAGVSPASTVETYAAVELRVNNWRWAGVPFFVRAGKRLSRHLSEIRVHFKRTPQTLFAPAPDEPNVVMLRIQPDEGISVSFVAKRPGSEMRTWPVQADFSYAAAFGGRAPTAYATLLLDAMRGDATLFTHRDEVEAEWRLITPIEDAWTQLPPPTFPNYPAGSVGPGDADALIGRDHRRWHPLGPQAP